MLVLGVVLAGCAKRPATTQAAAPAPTGAATTTPATGAPAAPATGATSGGGGAPTTAAPVRPAPSEFVSVPELKDIHFDFDKYDIRPGDAKT
ncbi:MAG TPA: hypothetical protein VFL90_14275, partial [Methylomirabilota bacterium]|nr:hypothetical protein [Methylomirabilota bacterium]